jgi:hypothetical protein
MCAAEPPCERPAEQQGAHLVEDEPHARSGRVGRHGQLLCHGRHGRRAGTQDTGAEAARRTSEQAQGARMLVTKERQNAGVQGKGASPGNCDSSFGPVPS